MPDKNGPSRDSERFQSIPENEKPHETIDTSKEMLKLAKGIKPKEQMPEDRQRVINELLKECKEGKCKSQKELKGNGYKAFDAGKFTNPDEVHPGHIGFLFANNVLAEGRPLDVGEYEIGKDEKGGYAFYHKG